MQPVTALIGGLAEYQFPSTKYSLFGVVDAGRAHGYSFAEFKVGGKLEFGGGSLFVNSVKGRSFGDYILAGARMID